MNTTLKLSALAAIAAVTMASCADNNDIVVPGGEGRVFISTTLNSDVKIRSRADLDELSNSAKIWVSNEKGLVYKFDTPSDVPTDGLRLLSDDYVAEAWAGDSVPASFTDRYFYGYTNFTVSSGDNKAIEIKASIANTVVAVTLDESLNGVMTDMSMTVGHSQGSLTFEGETLDRRGYFMMNSQDTALDWTFHGTLLDGTEYTRTGKIEDCHRATLYSMTVRCTETSVSEIGGAYFEIEIDDSVIETSEAIEIKSAPEIKGILFDLTKEQRAATGEMGRKSIWIAATSAITNLTLKSSVFTQDPFNFVESFDFITMQDVAAKDKIFNTGITYYYTYDEETEQSTLKLNFEDWYTNALTEGVYEFEITATDAADKSSKATLVLNVTDAPVSVAPVDELTVWPTKATISGLIEKDGITGARLCYRAKGSGTWIDAETTTNGKNLSANLTGLTPGTEYEFSAQAGDFISSPLSFTTEPALQVPNASFETWTKSGKVVIPGSNLQEFWDSGNHGSAKMSKNITDKSTDYAHSGQYSAKLVSQFVGLAGAGKFAAGNIFAGNYLYTNVTDGELGWGRPFATRPKAVKAWVRYEPGTVQSNGKGSHLSEGDKDKGTVYAAIVDGTTTKYDQSKSDYNGTNWPCVVKTKTTQLFDKRGANVVAIAEAVFDKATEGSGLVQIELPFEYLRTDKKGVYLIFVASASLYGDYFEGGEGSTLYLDDIEFVYE